MKKIMSMLVMSTTVLTLSSANDLDNRMMGIWFDITHSTPENMIALLLVDVQSDSVYYRGLITVTERREDGSYKIKRKTNIEWYTYNGKLNMKSGDSFDVIDGKDIYAGTDPQLTSSFVKLIITPEGRVNAILDDGLLVLEKIPGTEDILND